MVNARKIVVLGAVLLAGVAGFLYFSKGEEAVIKERFYHLAEQLAKSPQENELLAAAKAKRIGRMFAESCSVYIPAYDLDQKFSKTDVPSYIMTARSRYKKLALEFRDFKISVVSPTIARVDVTCLLKAETTAGETVRETREMAFNLKKPDKKWLFTAVEEVTVLEK